MKETKIIRKATEDGRNWRLTGETKLALDGATVLHRIQANQNLTFLWGTIIPKGTLGGWVENEGSLGNDVWIGDKAEVYGNAKITKESSLWGNCVVKDNVVLEESAIWGNARISDFAIIRKSSVSGNAIIADSSVIEMSDIAGYCSVAGKSHLTQVSCDENTHLIDSHIRNAGFSGDFYGDSLDIDYGEDMDEWYYPYYSPPQLLDKELMNRLRANQKGGLQEEVLFGNDERKFIADLKLVRTEKKHELTAMEVILTNPVVRYDGVEYNGQKIIDNLKDMHCDILDVGNERMSRMLSGSSVEINGRNYNIRLIGEELIVQDIAKRVSDVNIYSHRDGSMVIRCMIDNIQQGARTLSERDAQQLTNETDRNLLAVDYFSDSFQDEPDRNCGMRRL